MMTVLLPGMHPSFDALSACADQSAIAAARGPVGRHVRRCSACAATVAELRALGESARNVALPGAPAGLWDRIVAAEQAEGREPPAHALPSKMHVPSPLRSTMLVASPMRRTARRAGIAALAAAAAVVGIMMLPSPGRRTLSAAPDRGTWRFSPAVPLPGGTVRVRFEPPASLPPAERLLLLGQQLPRLAEPRPWDRYGIALMDSVATLHRGRDGSYEGSFTLPAGFVGVALHLTPMGGGFFPVPRDTVRVAHRVDVYAGRPMALLLAGTPDGRPRLDALSSAALSDWRAARSSVAYSVADTLIRYYPSEPIGYAVDQRIPGRRLLDDVIAYFRRGERQYVKFEQRLMKEPVVSVERELAMMVFANRISERGEARRWVMRLVREHPEDPRSLMAYAMMMSARFSHPGAIELVRQELPLADTLYERNGHRDLGGELASIAARAGDTAAYVRWTRRAWADRAGRTASFRQGFDAGILMDPSLRAAARAALEAELGESCTVPAGRYPVHVSRGFFRERCVGRQRDRYADLSLLWRLEGQPRKALAYADTAVSFGGFDDVCWYRGPRTRRGEALLALGDTAAALPELALRTVNGSWQELAFGDSVARALRPNVDSVSWAAARATAKQRFDACVTGQRARLKVTADSLKAAGAPPYFR